MQNLFFIIYISTLSFCLQEEPQNSDKVINYTLLIDKENSLIQRQIIEAVLPGSKKLYFIDLRENLISDLQEDTLFRIPVNIYELKNCDILREETFLILNDSIGINSSFVIKDTFSSYDLEEAMSFGLVLVDSIPRRLIKLKTRNNYIPKSISLSYIKKKYSNLGNKPTLFLLNGQIIFTRDYDHFMIDEYNLLEIQIKNPIENPGEKINFGIINMITTSEDSQKKIEELDFTLPNLIKEYDGKMKKKVKIKLPKQDSSELIFYDLTGNLIENIEGDTLFKVAVESKIRKIEESYVTINSSLFVNASFLHKNVLKTDLIEDKDSYGAMTLSALQPLRPYYDITLIDDLYIPKVISLSYIKQKYSDLNDKPTIFLLNGELLLSNTYDHFMIDEKNLLKLNIYKSFKNETDNIDVGIIELITKTKENLKIHRKNSFFN